MLPRSMFVLGGAASGKSAWAEAFLESAEKPIIYLATGRIADEEVAARVKIHRERRDARWTTVEAPLDLEPALTKLGGDDAVLVDCATMWLTNQMMCDADLGLARDGLLNALRGCAASWVVVSNEVGQGIVPENALARHFREAQGRLNIALAAEAAVVVQVVAGLPQVLKGRLA